MNVNMKFTFTSYDIQEISFSAGRAFLSTFRYLSDSSDSANSDSDLSDFDSSIYGCGEITEPVERMV